MDMGILSKVGSDGSIDK
jgi:hypothetical protein